MQVENLVPKVIHMLFKFICYVIVFFVLLNIFTFLYNYPRLVAISQMVQKSVEKHGYLPKKDYDSIQSYINAYTYQGQNVSSPLNINKVITNLNIVVFDMDADTSRGYPSDSELHKQLTQSDYSGGYGFYIDANDNAKGNKKQQGAVLIAGITCDYLIIHPMNGWHLFDQIVTNDGQAITKESIESAGGFTPQAAPDGSIIYGNNSTTRPLGYTTFNTLELFNTTGHKGNGLFISPVITCEYYPDLPNNEG